MNNITLKFVVIVEMENDMHVLDEFDPTSRSLIVNNNLIHNETHLMEDDIPLDELLELLKQLFKKNCPLS